MPETAEKNECRLVKRRHLRCAFLCLMIAAIAPGLWENPSRAGPPTSLLEDLGSPNSETRRQAIKGLGDAKSTISVVPLLDILRSPEADGQDRMDAAYALGRIGDRRAVEPLIALLEQDMTRRSGIMMAVIPALGQLGDRRAVPALRRALNNRKDHWLARNVAAEALGAIGAIKAVPDLIRAAWMADTRHPAILALSRIGDPRGVAVLISALANEEEPETRTAAMDGLVSLGKPAVPELGRLVKTFSNEFPNKAARIRAIRILGKIGGVAAQGIIAGAKDFSEADIREAATRAMEEALSREDR